MSDVIFTDENVMEFLDEMEPLFPLHYEELAVDKRFPYEPDYEKYRAMIACGMVRSITCRHEGKMVGYAVFFVHAAPHQKSCLTAFEDLYYLHPDYRNGGLGVKLFQFCEKVLRALGVQKIVIHTKVTHDHSALFEHLGYTFTDKLFTKALT